MRAFGKFLGRVLLTIAAVGVFMWIFGPRELVDLTPSFDSAQMGADLDAYFEGVESAYPDITPGAQKRVVWAGEPGARREWAVVYIHGFSATSEEIRPVPDRIAKALGANIVFTRLTGHGRSGDAMAEGSAEAWMNDVAEALEAGRRVGDKLLVISTSTGGTLMAAAAQNPQMMQGVVGSIFVSPNFGLNNPAAPLLTWPAARYWLPVIAGQRRSFEVRNEAHGKFWTTEYPSVAIFPMAALVKEVVALDHGKGTVPALFWYSREDKVVRPEASDAIKNAWGGPVAVVHPTLSDQDDPYAHVLAGSVMSPNQTEAAVQGMLTWVKSLP
jgi:alpha-beta hydrolase superfamily lysophospholipase